MHNNKAYTNLWTPSGLFLSTYSIFILLSNRQIRNSRGGDSDKDKEKTQKDLKSSKMLKSTGSPKPLRMWIDGKCFNIKKLQRKTKQTKTVIRTDFEDKTENIEVFNYSDEIDIVTTDDSGKLSLSFHLPSIYYIKLHQFTEFNSKHLSDKTQTIISWPKHGQSGKFVIEGNDKKNIEEALQEIHSVIGAIREQFTAAQFISIPILSSDVRTNFEKFKVGEQTEILNGPAITGMHESIFQSSLKLHLTVIVFALSNDREKAEALKVLDEYKNTVLCPLLEKTGPLKLLVRGIDCMQTNYKKTNVLYANVKIVNETEEVNLQGIVNDLANYFYERGLVLRHTENIKLHMTLINTKYRSNSNNPIPNRKRWVKRESFDASSIMEKYKDFVFGECDMNSIHLSLISSKGEDGFYKPLSIIKF